MLSCLVVCLSVCLSVRPAGGLLLLLMVSQPLPPSLPPSSSWWWSSLSLSVGLSGLIIMWVCLWVVVARSAPSGPAAVLVGYVVVIVILAGAGQCRTSAPAPPLLLLAPCLPACLPANGWLGPVLKRLSLSCTHSTPPFPLHNVLLKP